MEKGIVSISVAVVFCVLILTCCQPARVSDEAAIANATACTQVGKKPKVEVTPQRVIIGCE